MNQQDATLPSLALPRTDVVGKQAFEGDLLNRKELAVKLTGYLDRLREGAVLAIDAPWGEGKTWFGRNWEQYLKDEGHKVVFIDAFEQDYIEDPFLLLASEIAEIFDNEGAAKELREKAVGVMKAILPIGTKALINIMGHVALGSSNLSQNIKEGFEAVSDETSDATGKLIEEKIKNHAQEKESLQHFKEELTKFAAEQDKPVVIIIDELDRCKPTFAVQLIERVKHLFDVPNLVFVLLLNRNQLKNAVKGVYGAETDASAYLDKFVNFFFMLPKHNSFEIIYNNHTIDYVSDVFKRYNFDNNSGRHFKDCLSGMAIIYNMPLRGIEKAIALYAFAQPSNIDNIYLAYAITLKIMKQELFHRLSKDNDVEAHEEAKNIIEMNKELNRTNKVADIYLNPLLEWHEAHINDFKGEMGVQFENILGNFNMYHRTQKEKIFPYLADQIDLSIK